MIEICLPIWRRIHRLPDIVKDLNNQTFKDFRLNIWNNTEKSISLPKTSYEIRKFHHGPNLGSQARFKLVPKVEGKIIVFIDDDLILEPDFLEYNYGKLKEYGEDKICGWYSKLFRSTDYRDADCYLEEGTEAEYIGTGGMILNRDIFDKEESLQNIPSEFAQAEDLYLSMIARFKYKIKLIAVSKKCSILNDGLDQYRGLKEYKQKAYKLLLNKKW